MQTWAIWGPLGSNTPILSPEKAISEEFKAYHLSQCEKPSILIPKSVVFVCFKPNFCLILLSKKKSSQDFKTRLVRANENSTRTRKFRVSSNSVPALIVRAQLAAAQKERKKERKKENKTKSLKVAGELGGRSVGRRDHWGVTSCILRIPSTPLKLSQY